MHLSSSSAQRLVVSVLLALAMHSDASKRLRPVSGTKRAFLGSSSASSQEPDDVASPMQGTPTGSPLRRISRSKSRSRSRSKSPTHGNITPAPQTVPFDFTDFRNHCDAPKPSADAYKSVLDAQVAAIIAIHRHGHRTPWQSADNRLLKNQGQVLLCIDPANAGLPHAPTKDCAMDGQLTQFGANQLFEFGKAVHDIYYRSAPPASVTVVTSKKPRSIDSAVAFQMGLLAKPVNEASFDQSGADLFLAPSSMQCPRYEQVLTQIKASQNMLRTKALTATFDYEGHSMPRNDLFYLLDLYNVQHCAKPQLPVTRGASVDSRFRMTPDLHYTLFSLYTEELQALGASSDFMRLHGGRFMHYLLEQLNHLLANASKTKGSAPLLELSGHDHTIQTLQTVLGFAPHKIHWAPFAANFIIEVLQLSSGEFALRVLYNGQVMNLPWCDNKTVCPIDRVQTRFAEFSLDAAAFNQACKRMGRSY